MRTLVTLFLLLWPAASPAAVEVAFYSRGATFPHAFVTLSGTADDTGERVASNFGFTIRHQAGPAVLMGPVQGVVISEDAAYVSKSKRHFGFTLSDQEYRRVVQTIEKWKTLPQPSYRLNSRNCVFFVADIATIIGLQAAPNPKLMKKPRSFLQKVKAQNEQLIARRNAALP